MGEVVPYQPAAAVPSFTITDMEKVANAIARGGMFGSRDPFAVLTLCMVAQAEGKHPAVVFRDYDIIQGKPAKKAQAMQTDFFQAGGAIEWHRLDDEMADATFSHKQGGAVRITWDMTRANKAGLGTKDMWKKFPRQMLRARTISEGVRTVFPGATSGLFVTEEVADFDTPRAAAQERHEATVAAITAPEPDERTVKWVDGYIGKLDAADDSDALRAVLDANVDHMTRLEGRWPALYQRARDAERTREQALVQEKRPDDAYGEDEA